MRTQIKDKDELVGAVIEKFIPVDNGEAVLLLDGNRYCLLEAGLDDKHAVVMVSEDPLSLCYVECCTVMSWEERHTLARLQKRHGVP